MVVLKRVLLLIAGSVVKVGLGEKSRTKIVSSIANLLVLWVAFLVHLVLICLFVVPIYVDVKSEVYIPVQML